jgi:hypothetical protein
VKLKAAKLSSWEGWNSIRNQVQEWSEAPSLSKEKYGGARPAGYSLTRRIQAFSHVSEGLPSDGIMARNPLFSAVIVAATLASTGWAQDTLQDERAHEQAQTALIKLHKLEPASVILPGGAGAWAVRVIRTGGFDGRTVDVAVRSTGEVRCALSSGACTGDLSGNSLQSISALVTPVPMPEIKSELSGVCNDCFITRITMRRRESDGTEKIYFAYWDDVTMTRAPSELVRIAQAALALQR